MDARTSPPPKMLQPARVYHRLHRPTWCSCSFLLEYIVPPSCPLCHSVDSTVINFGSLQCRVIRPSPGQCGTKKVFFFPRSAGDTDLNIFHSGQRAMIHSVSQPLALHGGPACLKTLLRFTELPQAGLGPPSSANGLPASHNDSLISATHRDETLATANSPTVHASPLVSSPL